MERQFNLREGYNSMNEQIDKWNPVNKKVDYNREIPDKAEYEQIIRQYYEIHGWNAEGNPGDTN